VRFRCRVITKGVAEGEALVTKEYISFLGGVDDKTGVIREDCEIKGQSVAGKVLVFPGGKGSTVGTYVLLNLKKRGVAPKAIINRKTETIIAVGAAMAEIPLVEVRDEGFFEVVKSGDFLKVDSEECYVEILKS
jgi:predicted aconitase with swiveling domain